MLHEKTSFPERKEKSNNPFLKGAESTSPGEEQKQEGEMSFSFSSDTRRYYLGHKDGKPFFMIEYFDSLPNNLSEEEKRKFTQETKERDGIQKTVYLLTYGEVPESKEEMQEPDPNKSKTYRVAQSRDFERGMMDDFVTNDANKNIMRDILVEHSELNAEEISQIVEDLFEATRKQDRKTIRALSAQFSRNAAEKVKDVVKEKLLPKPQNMEADRLVEVLKRKKVLFYTGAGISVANGVHNMSQLKKLLGIDMSGKEDLFLKKATTHPQSVIDSWEEFTRAAFESPATPAHQSLGRLAQKTESQIFTENVDHLQERGGVKAIHVTGPWLKKTIHPEWLKDIDAVITIGLSYDDRGFLGWYKEHNPNGKIVAINVNQPSYLGSEDYLLEGDCQKVIPEIEAGLSR
ncbi:hypothetical protein KBB27_00610 [Patescibacteria group bacterium]|nr:hypothetical protein [Patescibacteria group bacterium]